METNKQTMAETAEQWSDLLYDRIMNGLVAEKHDKSNGTTELAMTVSHHTRQGDDGEEIFCIRYCVRLPDGELICREKCRPVSKKS